MRASDIIASPRFTSSEVESIRNYVKQFFENSKNI